MTALVRSLRLSPAFGRLWTPALVALILLTAPLFFQSGFHYRVAALVAITALAVTGLNILMGLAGQVSLGHAGFYGIGAYAVVLLPEHSGLHPLAALVAGALAAALIAWVIGRPILRLRGHYLAAATLGLGMLVAMVLTNEAWLTGGPDGIRVPRVEIGGWRLRGPETWYWIAAVVLVAGVIIAENLRNSPIGLAFNALHDSEVGTALMGVDVARAKLAAFVVSAVYAAVAGSLMAFLNGHITPDRAGFLQSIEFVTMAVLGGLGSFLGSLAGAVVLVVVPQMLTFFHQYEHLLLGAVIVAVLVFLPAGVVPTLARLLRGHE